MTQPDPTDTADTIAASTTPADTAAGASADTAWTPPTKAEFDKMQRDLAAANLESKNRREKLQELQRASEDADGKAARERAEAAEAKYKPVAVKAAAKAAFLEAGLAAVTPEKLARLTRMLDLDSIDITDDGDVKGLDDQVKALKAEFPEMFGGAAGKPRAPRLDAGDRRPADTRKRSSAELIAEMALNGTA